MNTNGEASLCLWAEESPHVLPPMIAPTLLAAMSVFTSTATEGGSFLRLEAMQLARPGVVKLRRLEAIRSSRTRASPR